MVFALFPWRAWVAAAALGFAAPLAGQGMPPAAALPVPSAIADDSAALAATLTGATVELTMRGTRLVITASAAPAEGGCATQLTARAARTGRSWSRLLRWSEVAWSGQSEEGRFGIAFFEPEGRLPADRLAFAPPDAAAFDGALTRLVAACRARHAPGERIGWLAPGGQRACYFARLPQLHVNESAAPKRAALTVLAEQTPQAELRLEFGRPATGSGEAPREWGSPAIAFEYADPLLGDLEIADARFELDGKLVAVAHAVTAFNHRRLRVSIDMTQGSERDPARFYQRLLASKAVTVTLVDAARRPRVAFAFAPGPAIAAAREVLAAGGESCAGAEVPPPPAAAWQREL